MNPSREEAFFALALEKPVQKLRPMIFTTILRSRHPSTMTQARTIPLNRRTRREQSGKQLLFTSVQAGGRIHRLVISVEPSPPSPTPCASLRSLRFPG